MMPKTIMVADIAADDSTPAGWSRSADGQRSINMTGCTLTEARVQLLQRCANDAERARILAGTLEIAEPGYFAPVSEGLRKRE